MQNTKDIPYKYFVTTVTVTVVTIHKYLTFKIIYHKIYQIFSTIYSTP